MTMNNQKNGNGKRILDSSTSSSPQTNSISPPSNRQDRLPHLDLQSTRLPAMIGLPANPTVSQDANQRVGELFTTALPSHRLALIISRPFQWSLGIPGNIEDAVVGSMIDGIQAWSNNQFLLQQLMEANHARASVYEYVSALSRVQDLLSSQTGPVARARVGNHGLARQVANSISAIAAHQQGERRPNAVPLDVHCVPDNGRTPEQATIDRENKDASHKQELNRLPRTSSGSHSIKSNQPNATGHVSASWNAHIDDRYSASSGRPHRSKRPRTNWYHSETAATTAYSSDTKGTGGNRERDSGWNVSNRKAQSERSRVNQVRFVPLSMESDTSVLSRYQCLARQQIEVFECSAEESDQSVQGRNQKVLGGQVGIRCKHCAGLPLKSRKTGSVYFPTRLDGVYQTAQKMAAGHLSKYCPLIPNETRSALLACKDEKSHTGGGIWYWVEGLRSLGVRENGRMGLGFKSVDMGDEGKSSPNKVKFS